VIGFVGDNFSRTRFHGCRAEEGDRALGWSPGQARAHTSEVGVGVGVGRHDVVRPVASALLRFALRGRGRLAGLHCSARPRPLSWAVRVWVLAVGSGSASGRVSPHSQFCYLKFLFFFQICL
jgi:hypothetical protein